MRNKTAIGFNKLIFGQIKPSAKIRQIALREKNKARFDSATAGTSVALKMKTVVKKSRHSISIKKKPVTGNGLYDMGSEGFEPTKA